MRSSRVRFALLFIACAVLARPWPVIAQGTIAADRFVDSVGVNVHLHYDNTPYRTQFPLIKSRLVELGVRHVRDGLEDTTWQPYYDRHNALGAAGIKGTFIVSPEQSTELWATYPARMASAFEAFEAPNEYNVHSGQADWVPVLTDTLERLRRLEDDGRVAHFPIFGPSLTSSTAYAALGDVSAHYDFANIHHYFAGRHPGTKGWGDGGYGSLAWSLALAAQYAPGKPVVATETGYQDNPSMANYVPQDVIGRYMPITLLEFFRAGVVRTFIYELCDYTKSGSFGLLNHDGSRKPAFTAVKSLLNLLADPGSAFTPVNLQYSVREGAGDIRHMNFQKRDGSYFVAIWQSRASYSPITRQRLHVPADRVVLTVPAAMRHVRTHVWQLDGSLSTTAWSPALPTMPVTIADRLVVVEVAQGPAPPANLRTAGADGSGSR